MLDYSPLWETLKKQDKSQYVLIDNGIDKRTMDHLSKPEDDLLSDIIAG